MERYKNVSGVSGVVAYDIGDTFIKVKFNGTPKIYVYNNIRPGQSHVQAMKQRALAGHGLQTYINKHRSAGYASIEY